MARASTSKKKSATKKAVTKKATSSPAAKKSAASKSAKKAVKKPAKKAVKKAGKKAGAKKVSAAKGAATKSSAKKAPTKKPAKAASSSKSSAAPAAKAKAAKTATKSKPKSKFDKKFLDEQRALLLEERAKYQKSATNLKAEADSLVEGREPGDVQFDEESGDGDSLAVERDRGLHMSAQARQQVEEIDAALARIDDGSYGMCSISGKPIPKERLRVLPWATERVEEKVGGFRR